jgi:DNA-binding MarR family transcriptional regulator
MDTQPSASKTLDYSSKPPALIAAATEAGRRRGARLVEDFGLRVGATLDIAQAAERVGLQGSASAIWIEVDKEADGLDTLLGTVDRDVADGRYGAVVAVNSNRLDRVIARVSDPAIEIVVDGDEAERATALALVLANSRASPALSDVASDRNAARIRQLSEEVSRIASTLARLSSGPPVATPRPAPPADDAPEIAAETVRAVIRARRLRARYFDEELFADPAWDMLLDLLQAEIAQLRVPVSSLCIAAAVPATTALRWLKTMVHQGLFLRRADPHDGRRVFVELAPPASKALRRYFAEVGKVSAI